MGIFIFSFTEQGTRLSAKLQKMLLQTQNNTDFNTVGCISYAPEKFAQDNAITPLYNKLQNVVGDLFKKGNALIFISACGIAVRSIAPFVNKKDSDPCVIVIDELGRFVVSLLSGHIGGGNEFTLKTAELINAVPVISTATDLNNIFAVDVFAKKNNLVISDMLIAKKISSLLLHKGKVGIYGKIPQGDNPEGIFTVKSSEDAKNKGIETGIQISPFSEPEIFLNTLNLIPKQAVIGIGCKRNTEPDKLYNFVSRILYEHHIYSKAVAAITSIDLKSQEPAIVSLAQKYNVPFITYNAQELMDIKGNFTASDFVKSITGADNVCERSSLAYSKAKELFINKTAENGMTVAISMLELNYKY